jgi:hypothetical protein
MKNLPILSNILIAAMLTGCAKETVTISPKPVAQSASAKLPGSPSPSPSILQWQKCLGSSADDFGNAVAKTTDGYFVAGYTTGINGNQDAFVSKTDLNGNLIWQTNVGGSSSDDAAGVVVTPDGGCLVAGYTNSNDGDITGKGGGDVLLFKLSASGEKEWVKTIGGTGYDRAFALINTLDGGYALTGNTASSDGDVTNSQVANGIAIVWLVKFNITTGAPVIDWQKTIGIFGTRDDVGYAVVQAAGGGYTIAGRTLTANGADIWIINTDNLGVRNWDKKITSSGADVGFGVAASIDINSNINGYVVTGYLSSNLVVVKLKLDGSIDWQKIFSSGSTTGRIQGRSVVSTTQGDIVVGLTNSKNGDIIASQGSDDLFVLRLDDTNGNKISSNVLGGKNLDAGKAVITTADGGYISVGNTSSTNGDVSGNHGGSDAWVVKFKF